MSDGPNHTPTTPRLFRSAGHARYEELTSQILNDHGVEDANGMILHRIICDALSAQALFFNAARRDPSQHQLDLFFEDFVLRCFAVSFTEGL